MKNKFLIILLLPLFLSLMGASCKVSDQATTVSMEPVTLNYWRVFDGPDDFQEIIAQYQAMHPYVKINYRKFRYEEYENEILHALAEDRGPDILSIHNTWIRKYETKLAPLPEQTQMVYLIASSSLKKEMIPELRTKRSLTVQNVKDRFVDAVVSDVVLDDGKIYGLPLSVDTLAMYYNRDLFNNAGITEPPAYWNRTFQQNVRNLTRQDARQNIVQSGAALGGADNIERSPDILAVLMMQNGANMMTGRQVTFHQIPPNSSNRNYNPGMEALRFYVDFASSNKEVYSWNELLPNSMDMFTQGNLAIMFGYSYHLPTIKSLSPKLNFGIAKLPQIENSPFEINFANYWVEVVSKKSPNVNEAWDFIQFMTNEQNVVTYLDKTNKPTALRSLINKQRESNEEIQVFIDQSLTAKSWYQGLRPEAAEEALKAMIEEAVEGTKSLIEIINTAASKVSQTIN